MKNRSELEKVYAVLKEQIGFVKKVLGLLPKGHLHHTFNRGLRVYYRVPEGKKVKDKVRIKERESIKAFVQKLFLETELKVMEENERAMEQLLERYEPVTGEGILNNMRVRDVDMVRAFLGTDDAEVIFRTLNPPGILSGDIVTIGPVYRPLTISRWQYDRIRSREEWANQPYNQNEAFPESKNKSKRLKR